MPCSDLLKIKLEMLGMGLWTKDYDNNGCVIQNLFFDVQYGEHADVGEGYGVCLGAF